MLKIQIILGSTRTERRGEKVAQWVYKEAQKRKDFKTEFLDLKEWNLPFYDEPTPKIAQKWCDKVREADGYIIVTPEYNHGYPAVLKNALDYPYEEWNRKPVGFVAYSTGRVGGARSVEQLKLVSIELQMVPMRQSVYVTKVKDAFDESGELTDPYYPKTITKLFDQLSWWAEALKKAREESS